MLIHIKHMGMVDTYYHPYYLSVNENCTVQSIYNIKETKTYIL
jgi:hypothetical protein